MYLRIAELLWLIRQFCIPNPFEVLGEGIFVEINGAEMLLTPYILNLISGAFLPSISYFFAGLYSDSFDSSQKSVMYMFFFCVNTVILYLLSFVYPTNWLINLIIVLYIGILGIVKVLINRSTIY
jgi:hypothetical protein